MQRPRLFWPLAQKAADMSRKGHRPGIPRIQPHRTLRQFGGTRGRGGRIGRPALADQE